MQKRIENYDWKWWKLLERFTKGTTQKQDGENLWEIWYFSRCFLGRRFRTVKGIQASFKSSKESKKSR